MKSIYAYNNQLHAPMISLIFLNIVDGLLTYLGLRLEFYIEMNIMLRNIYNYSPYLFLIVKVITPTIILSVLLFNLKECVSIITKSFVYIANIVYIFIVIYHIFLIFSLIA